MVQSKIQNIAPQAFTSSSILAEYRVSHSSQLSNSGRAQNCAPANLREIAPRNWF